MSFTHIVRTSAQVGSDPFPNPVTEADLTLTGELQTRLQQNIPGASTDLELELSADVSAIKSLLMFADRDMTIETNSAGAPAATISLKAGRTLQWDPAAYFTNPLGVTDVTSIFVTLAAGDDSVLNIDILHDPDA